MSSSKAIRAVRRARDVALACIGLVVTLPVSLITMLLFKCDSSGPAVYRQERVGEGGRLFTIFKFRSMHVEKAAPDVVSLWSTAHADPRVTRVGQILRRLHLGRTSSIGQRDSRRDEPRGTPPVSSAACCANWNPRYRTFVCDIW